MAKKSDKKKKGGTETVDRPAMAPSRLRKRFEDEVDAEVGSEFGLENPMSRPRVEKVVVNVNIGRYLDGAKVPPNVRSGAIETLTSITGQKPIVLKAKRSVANFKVREGMETAVMVTLRRDRMWHFLDRFINLATPRIKDFRGLSRKSFDGAGNYSVGLAEQAVWPEIDMGRAEFAHGMNINICFRNSDKQKSEFILEKLGMPFTRSE